MIFQYFCKLLVTSHFSFTDNVFYSYIDLSLVSQNTVLCGIELNGSTRFFVDALSPSSFTDQSPFIKHDLFEMTTVYLTLIEV